MKEITDEQIAERRKELEDWNMKNGVVFHPFRDNNHFIRVSLETGGGCPCDSKRLKCPCPESANECSLNGHCLCGLIMTEEYADLIRHQYGVGEGEHT